jgi:hypothetical protein
MLWDLLESSHFFIFIVIFVIPSIILLLIHSFECQWSICLIILLAAVEQMIYLIYNCLSFIAHFFNILYMRNWQRQS